MYILYESHLLDERMTQNKEDPQIKRIEEITIVRVAFEKIERKRNLRLRRELRLRSVL